MADDTLESNVVLRTKVMSPTGTGFTKLSEKLTALENQLKNISSQEYKIKFTLDDAGLRHANLQVVGKKAGEDIAQGIQQGVDQGLTQAQNIANRKDVKVKITVRETEEGTQVTTKRTQETSRGGKRIVTTQSGDTSTQEITMLEEAERAKRARRRAQIEAGHLIDIEEGSYGFAEDKQVEDLLRHRAVREATEMEKQNQLIEDKNGKMLRHRAVREVEERDKENRMVEDETAKMLRHRAVREAEEIEKADKEVNRKREANARKLRRQQRGEAVTAADRERGAREAQDAMEILRAQGFKEVTTQAIYNPRTQTTDIISEFQQIRRKGLGEWEVTVAKLNRDTGALKINTLDAAQSARRMGDSFGKAIEKVGLWLSATSVIFATVRGLQDAVRVTLQLEEATTLLARVGKNLGGPTVRQRMPQAREVQTEVVRFATLTGGDPEEAMKAAAVFARAGQNVRDVIESVKASMLAARIAEMGVLEAAELLSAAYLQFGMKASQVLPILNELNALSNSYRVTTDDLMQAISRAGSVVAQQNGRLSELAAVTAVTSQVTARSGAEIGNAIKTIASNLERLETREMLFEKLAFSTVDAEGNTKSYTRSLLEMQVALSRVSEAERNQIGVSVAGVRQRNFLLAQLSQVVEMIKAENLAIRQGEGRGAGSALEELRDTAGTLTAYLQRLRAEALKLVSEGGGPIMETAKDIVSVLTLMLQILSSGNGIPARFIVFTAGLYLAVRGLQVLTANVKLSSLAALEAATSHYFMGRAIMQTSGNAALAAAQFSAMRTQLATAAASAGLMIVQMGALFLVFTAVTAAIRSYQEGQEFLERAQKGAVDETERQINKEERRQKMLRETAMTVGYLADEIERLNKIQNKTPQDTAAIAEYKKQIQELMESAGLKGGGTPGAAADEGIRAYTEETKILAQKRKERIDVLTGQRAVQQGRMNATEQQMFEALMGGPRWMGDEWRNAQFRAPQSALGKSLNFAEGLPAADRKEWYRKEAKLFLETYMNAQRGNEDAIFELEAQQRDFSMKGPLGLMNSSYGELTRLAEEYAKSGKTIEEFTEEIDKQNRALKETTEALDQIIKKQKQLRELTSLAKGMAEREEYRKITDEGTGAIRQVFGETTDYQMVRGAVQETGKEVLRLMKLIDEFPASATRQEQKILLEHQKILRERKNQLTQIIAQSIQGQVRADIGGVSRMTEAMMMGRYEEQMAREREPGLSSGVVRAGASQRVSIARIKQLKDAFDSVTLKAGAEGTPGVDKKLQQGIEQRELAKEIQAELVRMADLEVQKASELFRLESQITVERRKSADEAARALGVLSNTDKMRAFAQAAYLVKNPGKMFTFEEQFRMRSEDVSLGRQFFGGRYEDRLDPKRGPLARAFEDAGIGGSYELNRAAARAKEFRRGRTDEEVIKDARKTSSRYRAEAEGIGGGVGIRPSYTLGGSYDSAGRSSQPPLNVTAQVEFRPMVEEFSKILQLEGQEIIKLAREQFAEDYRRFRNFRHTVPASTSTD